MNCEKFQENISLYLDNKLSAQEVDELLKHLQSCAQCKQFYNDLVKVKKILSSSAKPKIKVSADFTNSIMQDIYKIQNKKKDKVININFSIRKYFAVAASFIFIVSASVYFVMNQHKSNLTSAAFDSEAIFDVYDYQYDNIYEGDVTAFLSMY